MNFFTGLPPCVVIFTLKYKRCLFPGNFGEIKFWLTFGLILVNLRSYNDLYVILFAE